MSQFDPSKLIRHHDSKVYIVSKKRILSSSINPTFMRVFECFEDAIKHCSTDDQIIGPVDFIKKTEPYDFDKEPYDKEPFDKEPFDKDKDPFDFFKNKKDGKKPFGFGSGSGSGIPGMIEHDF